MVSANFGFVTPENLSLLTDLYELTMADSYYRRGKNQWVVFDLFVRGIPECRNFLCICWPGTGGLLSGEFKVF